MTTINSFVKRHPLATFFILTLALSAPFQLAQASLNTQSVSAQILPLLLIFLISWCPAIAALVVLAILRDRDENREFRRRLWHWRVSPRWYLAALLLPVVPWLVAVDMLAAVGFPTAYQPIFLAFAPLGFFANLGEELGWRGFALPRLQARYSALAASIILALFWSLLHVLTYLPFPIEQALGLYGAFFAILVAQSIIMTWIFNSTRGSLILMVLFHASFDLAALVLPAHGTSLAFRAFVAARYWIVAGIVILRYRESLLQKPTPIVQSVGGSV